MSNLITLKLASPSQNPPEYKAISALVPYAIFLGRDGHQGMIDEISRVFSTSNSGGFVWHRLNPYLTTLFNESSPPPLNRVFTLLSPYVPWDEKSHNGHTVSRWAAAALAVPYTEEVGCRVVDALLQIAFIDPLRPHIPTDLWAWLKKLPCLPPESKGLGVGKEEAVVRHVRWLGDVEILKSYFLVVWSEWNFLFTAGFDEMRISVREDFGGGECKRHREDLVARLDHVLRELDRGWRYIVQYKPGIVENQLRRAKAHYRRLKEILLEVDGVFSGLVRQLSPCDL